MNNDAKEATPKERIVVLEKGKAINIDAWCPCCFAPFMPIRAW